MVVSCPLPLSGGRGTTRLVSTSECQLRGVPRHMEISPQPCGCDTVDPHLPEVEPEVTTLVM